MQNKGITRKGGKGGYGALLSKSSTRKYCFDTKTLNGVQGEMEEPEFSQVNPFLFVGGSANSQRPFFFFFTLLINFVNYIKNNKQQISLMI